MILKELKKYYNMIICVHLLQISIWEEHDFDCLNFFFVIEKKREVYDKYGLDGLRQHEEGMC